MSTNYVLGFAFDTDDNVVLIRKKRPMWQANRLNGVGGKIEEGEMAEQAMRREFREETGVDCMFWNYFLLLDGKDFSVYCFYTLTVDIKEVKSVTDEDVLVVDSWFLPDDVLFNLRWILPLALDGDLRNALPTVVRY